MENDNNDGAPRRESPLAAAARRLAEERAREEAEAAASGAQPAAPRWQPPAAPEPTPPASPPTPPPTPPAPVPPSSWTTAAYPAPPAASAYPPPPQPSSASGDYSAWWKRVLAAILDGVVISIPVGVLGAVLGAKGSQTNLVTGEVSFHPNTAYWILVLVGFVAPLVYYAFLEGGAGGQSVGKMALNIQVRDADDGGPIGYGRAFARRLVATLLWWLLVIPGLIDVLWPLWDSRRQTLHDKAVNTVVVDKA